MLKLPHRDLTKDTISTLLSMGQILWVKIWSLMVGSNRRPMVYDTIALPTELIRHSIEKTGFEPVTSALSGHCATTAPLLEKKYG